MTPYLLFLTFSKGFSLTAPSHFLSPSSTSSRIASGFVSIRFSNRKSLIRSRSSFSGAKVMLARYGTFFSRTDRVPGNPHQHAQCAGNILYKRKIIVPRGELNGAMRGRGMPGFIDECHSLSMLFRPYLKQPLAEPHERAGENFFTATPRKLLTHPKPIEDFENCRFPWHTSISFII